MNIFSSQYTRPALVCIGLLAVLLAYRSNGSQNGAEKSSRHQPIRISQQQSTLTLPTEMASAPVQQYSSTTGFDDWDIAPEPAPADLPPAVEPMKDEPLELELAELHSESTIEPELKVEGNQFRETQIETGFESKNVAKVVDFVDSEPAPAPAPPVITAAPEYNEAAALKAVHHIEYGKSLARRNATEAASQEFLGALRVLAEANDTSIGNNQYVAAMRNGLMAIEEAADFKTDDPQRQIVMNVANIIEGHETRVLGMNEARTISASMAMRRYFEYAGQQLGMCGGQNPVAAEALYCLGKMRTIASQSNPDPESLEIYEAIIFHHASLASDPRNHRSANELGVLLARNGHLDAAETYLKNSLRLSPTAQTWANLAKVHQRKGTPEDQKLANLAMKEYQVALNRPANGAASGSIVWVDPQEFAARSPVQLHQGDVAPKQTGQVVPASNLQPAGEDPSFVERIGSLFTPRSFKR